MSVNTYLSGLASDLVLSQTEKSNITKSIDTIKKRLDLYFSILILEITVVCVASADRA